MNEYIIEDDKTKLISYTLLNFTITIIFMIISAFFYSTGLFIISFLSITGMWFSVKAMCRYGKRLIKKIPVCEFNKSEVIIHSLPDENNSMKYKEIREVKIMEDWKSLKLFFSGEKVTHPSGWTYVGIIYPFQRNLLDETKENVITYLENHKVKYSIVDKN